MTTLTLVRGAATFTPAPVLGDLTYTTIPAGLCREALHAYHVGFNRAAKRFSKLNPAPAVMHDDDTAPAAGTAARKALGEELAAAGRVWRAERHPMAHKSGMSDVRKFYRRRGDGAALAALVDPFGVIPARAAARTVAAMVESDRVAVVTVPAVPARRTRTTGRPDMRGYFRARIEHHVHGMMAGAPARLPAGVDRVDGDVTDTLIRVIMRSGDVFTWAGGEYAARKTHGTYAPRMPRPFGNVDPAPVVAAELTRCGGCGAYALPAGAAGPVCCTVPGAVALTWSDVAPATPAADVDGATSDAATLPTCSGRTGGAHGVPYCHQNAGGCPLHYPTTTSETSADVDGLPGWLADLPVRLRKPARRLLAARVREVGLDPRGDVWARAVAGELPGVVLPVRGDVDTSVTA